MLRTDCIQPRVMTALCLLSVVTLLFDVYS